MSTSHPAPTIETHSWVVSISVATFPGQRPELQLRVLGNRHTLKDVANFIFDCYLADVRGEELEDHLWRFEPKGAVYGVALNHELPLLSPDMSFKGRFEEESTATSFPLREGSEMNFWYDEGSPTVLYVHLDSVRPMPLGRAETDYPIEVKDLSAQQEELKRQRLSEAPPLTILMDEAYPHVAHRWLRDHQIHVDLGRGCEPYDQSEGNVWCQIWGGGFQMAFTSSLECFFPFSDMDEFWWCCEKGIEKQISPGHPSLMKKKYKTRIDSGETYETVTVLDDLQVIVSVYPSSIPATQYRPTIVRDMCFDCFSSATEKVVRSESTWSFNVALPVDWKESTNPPNFSFTRQFPKCSQWLTHSTTKCYWMKMEGGVLSAVTGRNHPKKPDNVVHRTLKHTTLHAMFQDMEEQLVLPKSWKKKK